MIFLFTTLKIPHQCKKGDHSCRVPLFCSRPLPTYRRNSDLVSTTHVTQIETDLTQLRNLFRGLSYPMFPNHLFNITFGLWKRIRNLTHSRYIEHFTRPFCLLQRDWQLLIWSTERLVFYHKFCYIKLNIFMTLC